jgi:hypothetical protein
MLWAGGGGASDALAGSGHNSYRIFHDVSSEGVSGYFKKALPALLLEEQLLDMRGEIVEGVLEFVCIRGVTVAEAYVVRGDYVEFFRELRDEVAEHVRRTGETVQQHDGR